MLLRGKGNDPEDAIMAQEEPQSKRLFIGGLYGGVTESELKSRFEPFGSITGVEIRNKTGSSSKTFAYLNCDITEKKLQQCMKIYNKCKWKGKELQIQVAKENFLDRLKKEQEGESCVKEVIPEEERGLEKTDADESKTIRELVVKGAAPGAPVDGKKDWVVGKYGRALPVVKLRRRDQKKVMTVDPSKFCHFVKKLENKPSKSNSRDDMNASTKDLTWQMEDQDTEIVKRIRGEFPEYKSPKSKRKPSSLNTSLISNTPEVAKEDDFEVVTSEPGVRFQATLSAGSKFGGDSDSGADTDDIISGMKSSTSKPKKKATREPNDLKTTPNKEKKTPKKKEGGEDSSLPKNRKRTLKPEPTVSVTSKKVKGQSLLEADSVASVPKNGYDSGDSADTDEIIAVKRCSLQPRRDRDSFLSSEQQRLNQSAHSEYSSGFSQSQTIEPVKRTKPNWTTYYSDSEDDVFDLIAEGKVQQLYSLKTTQETKTKKVPPPMSSATTDKTNSQNFKRLPFDKTLQNWDLQVDDKRVSPKSYRQKSPSADQKFSITKEVKSPKVSNSDKGTAHKASTSKTPEEQIKTQPQPSSKTLDVSGSKDTKKTPDGSGSIVMKHISKEKKHEADNLKRLQSLKERQKEAEAQRSVIQKALASVDSQPANKKIVFESDSEEEILSRKKPSLQTKTKLDMSSKSDNDSLSESCSAESSSDSCDMADDLEGENDSAEERKDLERVKESRGKKMVQKEKTQKTETKTRRKDDKSSQQSEDSSSESSASSDDELSDDESADDDSTESSHKSSAEEESSESNSKELDFQMKVNDEKKDKKTLFNSSSESDGEESPSRKEPLMRKKKTSKESLQRPKLFEDTSDSESDGLDTDEEEADKQMFRHRPEFEGEAGKKLLALQSKFGNDQRFKLDKRFLDGGDSEEDSAIEEDEVQEEEEDNEMISDVGIQSEREKALRILEGVVGSKALQKAKKQAKPFRDVSTLQYDPTKEGHEQFEVVKDKHKQDPETKEPKKKKKKKDQTSVESQEAEPEEANLPEVSGDRFFEVQGSLKDAFKKTQEDGSFSLVSLFGNKAEDAEEAENDDPNVESETTNISKPVRLPPRLSWQPPLSDSSSEGEEEEAEEDAEKEVNDIKQDTVLNTTGNTERKTFFFIEQDYRLKDAKSFCRSEDLDVIREKWQEKRDDLIQSYRLIRKRKLRSLKTSGPGGFKRRP